VKKNSFELLELEMADLERFWRKTPLGPLGVKMCYNFCHEILSRYVEIGWNLESRLSGSVSFHPHGSIFKKSSWFGQLRNKSSNLGQRILMKHLTLKVWGVVQIPRIVKKCYKVQLRSIILWWFWNQGCKSWHIDYICMLGSTIAFTNIF
jgi:hypothetical protein